MQCGAACLTMIANSYGAKCVPQNMFHKCYILGKMACQCLQLQKLQMKLVSIAKGKYILLNN